MSLALARQEASALASLADEIRVEHEACERDARSAVDHAIRAGELLLDAKVKVRHGEWLPWLEKNFPATVQTASGYMRLASNRGQIENASSIRGALADLAEPRATPSNGATPPVETEPEVVDAEVVPPKEPRAPRQSDPPAQHLPDLYDEGATENPRVQVVHWFDQGRHVKSLLDAGLALEAKSPEDKQALKADAQLMIELARDIRRLVK